MEVDRKSIFYVGSFSEYLYVMELDKDKEEIFILNRIGRSNRPSYLCMPDNRKYLYSANEISDGLGGVSAYDISDKYNPRHINTISFNAAGPCHVSLAEDQHELLSASYSDGRVFINPINRDGSLNECSVIIQHKNGDPLRKGAVLSSQSQARAHFICQVPGTGYVLVTDLGADKVYVYVLEKDNLVEHSIMQTVSGAGPRHIEIHPSGNTIYLINELNSTINVLHFNKETGVLASVQQVSTLPPEYNGSSFCSAIHMSADGRFLYGANRGYDSIAVFSINEKDHNIILKGYLPLSQKTPRDFVIDPSGKYMIIGNMNSDSISLCRLSGETGMPELISHVDGIEKPSNFLFLR